MGDEKTAGNAYEPGNGAGHWIYIALFALLYAAVVALVLLYELDYRTAPLPWLPLIDAQAVGYDQVRLLFMALTAFAALGVLAWGAMRQFAFARRPGFTLLVRIVLVIAVFAAGLNYFYARPGLAKGQYAHRHDSFHYFLHPRYYAEMDYADLYACAVEALGAGAIPDDTRVRDLRNYRMTTAGALRARALCPRDNFSDARWARFEQDLQVLVRSHDGRNILRKALADRGYNGTPVHAALSGALAARIPLAAASLNVLGLLDAFFICTMLAAVVLGFGATTGLLFALSVFVMAADRWTVIGSSWFRYGWYLCLALGIVALHRGRYGWSGMWLALSALLNVFPIVFAAGVAVRGVAHCIAERRLVPRYVRFALAGLLTAVLGLAIGALPARHIDNYTGWVANMQQHQTERFQAFGVGLKFPFAYRGANTQATDNVPESARRDLFHERRPAYHALAIVLLALAVMIAVRTRDDVEAATILGFTLMFTLLGTVHYYFACASLVLLGLHGRLWTIGGTLLAALWFAASFLAHWALYATGYYRLAYNTVLSVAWSVWLAVTLFWLAWQLGIFRSPGSAGAQIAARLETPQREHP